MLVNVCSFISFDTRGVENRPSWYTLDLIVSVGTTVADVAGEVIETGAEVRNLKAGDKVVAMLSIFVSVIFLIAFAFELICLIIYYLHNGRQQLVMKIPQLAVVCTNMFISIPK